MARELINTARQLYGVNRCEGPTIDVLPSIKAGIDIPNLPEIRRNNRLCETGRPSIRPKGIVILDTSAQSIFNISNRDRIFSIPLVGNFKNAAVKRRLAKRLLDFVGRKGIIKEFIVITYGTDASSKFATETLQKSGYTFVFDGRKILPNLPIP